ncbi:MAG: hypothetical protein OET79_05335 [Nitrospirota bacterium]|nr:hypothetical protein [Nitrospirota bacterium]
MVYNNGPSGYGIDILSRSSGAIVKNNIIYDNATPIVNNGINTAMGNNLLNNPFFVNQSNGDFHLQAGSPAIDIGITISGITTDHDGNSRPQGSTFDIGAYEFPSCSGGGGSATFPAPMSTPAPGSTLTSTSVTFTDGQQKLVLSSRFPA